MDQKVYPIVDLVLLGTIISAVSSRRVKQEMAKQGVGPVNIAGVMLRIVLIAMFFSVDISYVVKELNRRIKLRRFAKDAFSLLTQRRNYRRLPTGSW